MISAPQSSGAHEHGVDADDADERIPLIYAIYTKEFYGTEKMSLATAHGLRDTFDPVIIITPPGPAAAAARAMGFEVVETSSARAKGRPWGLGAFEFVGFSKLLGTYLAKYERLAYFGTHSAHAVCFAAMNLRYRRDAAHVSVVHGYDGDGYYRAQRLLNALPVTIVGVSQAVRARLVGFGVRGDRVRVIENFLSDDAIAAAPRREPFRERGIRHVAVVGRLAAVKRLDLLLTCLEARPQLGTIAFHLFGDGPDRDQLERRARASGLNVIFEGFRPDVPAQLATVDLLLHLRPDEPFGLVLLEGMAAGIPVLVSDGDGTGSIVEHGVSGLHFAAGDPNSLGEWLEALQNAEPDQLNALAAGGRTALQTRFSERARLADYRALIAEKLRPRSAQHAGPKRQRRSG